MRTYQGNCHAHDYGYIYKVKGSDLQQAAVLVRVYVDIFISDRWLKMFQTVFLELGRLKKNKSNQFTIKLLHVHELSVLEIVCAN